MRSGLSRDLDSATGGASEEDGRGRFLDETVGVEARVMSPEEGGGWGQVESLFGGDGDPPL